MLITFNCDWGTPEDNLKRRANRRKGMSAGIGIRWRPQCPANENLPAWLEIYG